MNNTNAFKHKFPIALIILFMLVAPFTTAAQDYFDFEEDSARFEPVDSRLTNNEAEYIFLSDRDDLAIIGLYPCDSIAPSYQFVDNQYQYLVRLRQLKRNKGRTIHFAIKGTNFASDLRIYAKRQSSHFVKIKSKPTVIRLSEVGSAVVMVAGEKNAVQMVFRSKLSLLVSSNDSAARIESDISDAGLNEYRVTIDRSFIDPEEDSVFVQIADGSSNLIKIPLSVIKSAPKGQKVYEISKVAPPSSGKPKETTLKLNVQSSGANEIIFLDGEQLEVNVYNKYVFLGRHDIRIEAPMYHPIDTFVVLNDPSADNSFSFTLQPAVGYLSVIGAAAKSGVVHIDGKEVATAPTSTPIHLSLGSHLVEVDKRGFYPFRQYVDILNADTAVLVPHLFKRNKVVPAEGLRRVNMHVTPLKCRPLVELYSPSGDTIIVEIDKRGEGSVGLAPGTYSYFASAPQYYPSAGTLIVDSITSITLDLELNPNYGSLVVQNDLLRDAAIYLDNTKIGRIPFSKTHITSGVHYLQIEPRDGVSIPIRQRIEILDNQTTRITDLQRKRKHVYLSFVAEDDVLVYINGINNGFGTTYPQPFRHSPIEVTCKRQGYYDTTILYRFDLGSNDTSVVLPRMRKMTGFLTVDCTPSEAGIYIDGERIGDSPISNHPIPIGTCTIAINKSGYERFDTTLVVGVDDMVILKNIHLKKEKKTLPHRTLLIAGFVPYSGQGSLSANLDAIIGRDNSPVIGFTLGRVKRLGWYVSAFTNLNFQSPSNSVNESGIRQDGSLVLFDGDYPCSLSYLTASLGINLKVVRPLWIYAGAGYGVKIPIVIDASGTDYYVSTHTARGLCAEAGLGLELGPFALTAGINIINPDAFFQGKPNASYTWRCGVGFSL